MLSKSDFQDNNIRLIMSNHEINKKQFFEQGWCRFEYDLNIALWIKAVLPHARKAVQAKENEKWLRCGGTWFAGVNVLPNRPDGSIDESPNLQGEVIDFIHQIIQFDPIKSDQIKLDQAQISVCYPGYPQPMPSESEEAFGFRQNRDAAHVDGFLAEGPKRRRFLREYHGFILGLPLVNFDEAASPIVVWEGSHKLVREAMVTRFSGHDVETWGMQDITDSYHAVRQKVFEQCRRITISAKPGEAYLLHRLVVHGVAPWHESTKSSSDGRMICYFRPEISSAESWLNDP